MLFPKIYLQDPEIFSFVLFISGLKPKIPGLLILGFNPEINNTKLNFSGSCKYILGRLREQYIKSPQVSCVC